VPQSAPLSPDLTAMHSEIVDLLVHVGKHPVARPAARQAADAIAASVVEYHRDRGNALAWQDVWTLKRERAWLQEVARCAKALKECLLRRRSAGYVVRQDLPEVVLLPSAMDVYGLGGDKEVAWLRGLHDHAERLTQGITRPPEHRHRPADHWRSQLEIDVGVTLKAAGVRLTTAESGVLARVFEKVLPIIGVDGDGAAKKSAVRVCKRLAEPQPATGPKLSPR
jgi:hypothetical protein